MQPCFLWKLHQWLMHECINGINVQVLECSNAETKMQSKSLRLEMLNQNNGHTRKSTSGSKLMQQMGWQPSTERKTHWRTSKYTFLQCRARPWSRLCHAGSPCNDTKSFLLHRQVCKTNVLAALFLLHHQAWKASSSLFQTMADAGTAALLALPIRKLLDPWS